ncbi:MAG: glycosyltransferase family 4 protein [Pseudomonadales bacterium]
MGAHILYVVNDSGFFVSHRLVLAQAARAAGYRVTIAAGPGGAEDEIVAAGFEYRALPINRGAVKPLGELRLILAIAALYRSVRPDLVHLVTIKPALYGGILARLLRVPAVVVAVTGMGYLFTGERRSFIRRAAEYLYRSALLHTNGRVILQNEADWQVLVELRALREGCGVLVPGSGVDLSVFSPCPLPPGAPIVLLPARMLWDKGIGEFVEAARIIQARGIDARFVLVGPSDPDNPSAIGTNQLDAWQCDGVVEWWGMRKDMPAVMASASLVVLPSYREGMPKALLEAAAAGRAIVTTDVPGCRDVVEPGENGEMVPARDARALADAIYSLLSNRDQLERLGRRSRVIAENRFGVADIVAAHMAIYNELCENILEQ